MMKKKIIATMLAMSVASFAAGGLSQSQAFSLGSILKLGGITYAVDRYGSEINNVLNKLLKQHNFENTYATKVVPIVTLGGGGYIGAAQVTGPTDQVNQVRAVAQVEGGFGGIARLKGLVPVDNINPTKASRVQGVGISAIIDIKI